MLNMSKENILENLNDGVTLVCYLTSGTGMKLNPDSLEKVVSEKAVKETMGKSEVVASQLYGDKLEKIVQVTTLFCGDKERNLSDMVRSLKDVMKIADEYNVDDIRIPSFGEAFDSKVFKALQPILEKETDNRVTFYENVAVVERKKKTIKIIDLFDGVEAVATKPGVKTNIALIVDGTPGVEVGRFKKELEIVLNGIAKDKKDVTLITRGTGKNVPADVVRYAEKHGMEVITTEVDKYCTSQDTRCIVKAIEIAKTYKERYVLVLRNTESVDEIPMMTYIIGEQYKLPKRLVVVNE